MQKISRMYLGNCGYTTSWYPGTELVLTDVDSGDATDTILNLENGGGKTTLLALIFSCFETHESKFLKRLQSDNASFSQYFDHSGIPGVIATEWVMPPRSAGSQPYRLIIGQVVSVRASAEPMEVDRLFFSFEEKAHLGFRDIPAPGLAATPAPSISDFSKWAHEQQKSQPDFFVIRNNQKDWQRHLREERGIDLDMLKMQVNFSKSEGGLDSGFLDFKSEAEFVRKFLGLTLEPQKAEEARRNVVETCEKPPRVTIVVAPIGPEPLGFGFH